MLQALASPCRTTGGDRVLDELGDGAAILRVNPRTLRARMWRLGIDWAAFRP